MKTSNLVFRAIRCIVCSALIMRAAELQARHPEGMEGACEGQRTPHAGTCRRPPTLVVDG